MLSCIWYWGAPFPFVKFAGGSEQGQIAKSAVETFSKEFPQFTYFFAEGSLAGRVRGFIGLRGSDAAVAIVDVKAQEFFFYEGEFEASLLKVDDPAVVSLA